MTDNFVYDSVALPADKIDSAGGSAPLVANPTRKWSPNDANRVFLALTDTRTSILANPVNAKQFHVVGDGVADDTAALQAAITASPGRTLYIPKGKYKVTSTLFITDRSMHIVGDFPNRNTEFGTEISYTGTGPCIQLHTDSGNPWSDNEYNGKQDHIFEHLCFRHAAPDTALIAAGDATLRVKLGAYGIWDWRGGGITMNRCMFEQFEASFVGIQSDINTFIECKSSYSKYGWYLGPRSDQNTIISQESIFCDRAITIDIAGGTRILTSQFVGCGTSTAATIEIRRASGGGPFGISIESCWFETGLGYQGTDKLSFVSVGEVDGYGSGGSIQSAGGSPSTGAVGGCRIESPQCLTILPATATHVKYLASVGKCLQFVLRNPTNQPSGSLTNLDALVGIQAAQSPTNVETQILVTEVNSTLTDAKCFVNLGGGSPAINIDKHGATGRILASNITLGGSTAAVHTVSGTVTQTLPTNTTTGGLLVQNTTANTANSTCIRGLHTGTVDTSGGFRTVTAVNASVNATRSAGASSLENTGLLCTAAGGQTNRALATLDGDVQLNTTSGATVLNKSVRYPNELVPASIGANQDNYNPTGFSDASSLILTSSGAFNITGFVIGTADGRRLPVYNNGANNITLKHQDAASTAANRIVGRGAADVVLTPNLGCELLYSASIDRWLVL